MERVADQYNERGLLIHESDAPDGERLDHYLARVRPDLGDEAFWYSECDEGRIQVRDHWNPATGMYDRTSWFIRWYDGERWRVMDLPAGERPRMRAGFCHIVKES